MSERSPSQLVTQIGRLHIDWPRSVGYFGGIAVALALELIAPEIALFVAVIPLVKLLKRKDAPRIEKVIAEVIEGAAIPLGGDAESTVRLAAEEEPFWEDEGQPLTH